MLNTADGVPTKVQIPIECAQMPFETAYVRERFVADNIDDGTGDSRSVFNYVTNQSFEPTYTPPHRLETIQKG